MSPTATCSGPRRARVDPKALQERAHADAFVDAGDDEVGLRVAAIGADTRVPAARSAPGIVASEAGADGRGGRARTRGRHAGRRIEVHAVDAAERAAHALEDDGLLDGHEPGRPSPATWTTAPYSATPPASR